MAEQFKIYFNSLPPDKIDGIENDFKANGNGLLPVRQMESATEPFDSFTMLYYINGRLPYRDGHLFIPDGETRAGIIEEKLSLKELLAKFFRKGSNWPCLISIFCCPTAVFCRKRNPSKKFSYGIV